MQLAAGRRVGPYEVVSPVGAGGMGEVYRARDTRLGRDVALKVLPADRSGDADRLRRFEREARAVAALNHPNILVVFDIGSEDGAPYVVFELLEGQTVRRRLDRAPLPVRKAIEHAIQICRGLSAAHATGILHRDLKPENLFLTSDGQVKILDFGLAKLTEPAEGSGLDDLETPTATDSRVQLGTVGYMSPEQVRGQRLDSRSDLFSLGAVLYEMLSGRRAFEGETSADTLSAILHRDPPEITSGPDRLPSGIERIVRRCLEKDPEERFQTARDLAFALEAVSGPSQAEASPIAAAPARRQWLPDGAAALLLLAGLAGAVLWGARRANTPFPTYKQLTFRRGVVIDDARFTADGNTVVYSGLWDGNPPETFTTRLDTPVSRSLGLPPGRLLSVSSQAELAILLGKPGDARGDWQGTLARVPLSGGIPREVLQDVLRADWSPDGRDLAVVRVVEGKARLEYPIGHALRNLVSVWVSSGATPPALLPDVILRVSPQGDRVALSSGEGLFVIDRAGHATEIGLGVRGAQGLVWAPSGDAMWVGGPTGALGSSESLWYATLDGKATEVARVPGHLFLHDVSRDGRFLIHLGSERLPAMAKAPGEAAERELTIFDWSAPVGISADGSQVLLGDFSTSASASFLRSMRGGPAVPVAEGRPVALSPDARWVLAIRRGLEPPQFVLSPTAAGEPRSMPSERLEGIDAGWFADAGHVVFNAAKPRGRQRAFVLDLRAGKVAPVTPEGTLAVPGSLSNGFFIAYGLDETLAWYPLAGGEAQPITARVPKGTYPVQASADRRFLFVGEAGVPGRIDRLDLATGRRNPWKRLKPEDPTGVYMVEGFKVSPDGRAYAYCYERYLQHLYVVEGLR
ncbi:MAG TPA: serine/threonine-protein kinase [Vicinamibacteria bacterium]|nr:serine/threonine-protein kinase [Vicinamibacteria bacterium]